MVIQANFLIQVGEKLRVDRIVLGSLRSSWGTVAEGREGHRTEDRANGTRVYWVHVR
jgi:hypothetical protein